MHEREVGRGGELRDESPSSIKPDLENALSSELGASSTET